MNHMIKSILSGFSILLFSNFVRGELFEICKPNPTSPITIHFTWVGSDLFDQKNAQIVKNLENFCAALQYKPIKRDVPEIIDSEIFLWTEKSLSKSLEKICPNINIKQKNVSELLTDEVLKNGYEFFKNNNLFALASDTLRPILMKKYGGCYFDIGKKYSDRTFILKPSINFPFIPNPLLEHRLALLFIIRALWLQKMFHRCPIKSLINIKQI
jgi:hypothetical protein